MALAVAMALLGGCDDPDIDLTEVGLLTADDLGEGWEADSDAEPEAGPFRSGGGDDPPECERLALDTSAGALTEGISPAFLQGDFEADPPWFVTAQNFVNVFRDETIATRAFDAYHVAEDVEPCLEVMMSALVDMFTADPLAALAVGSYELGTEPLPVPALGEGTVGWRGRIQLGLADIPGAPDQIPVTVDLVTTRLGRAMSVLLLAGFNVDPPAEARDLAATAIASRLGGGGDALRSGRTHEPRRPPPTI